MTSIQIETIASAPKRYQPHVPLPAPPFRLGRLRLAYRWSRYFLWSASHGHLPGMSAAAQSLVKLGTLALRDGLLRQRNVVCNICGWSGAAFYPNTGSGYFELDTNCPQCSCIHRYRTLAAILDRETDFFSPDKMVIEVAPVRGFQAYCLWRKEEKNYLSFDLEKFGMEQGDLTAMRYADAACDYFLCYHVLEHVSADTVAMKEIFRVLRPGGLGVFQVPIDYSIREIIEYGKPNPLETGHVRRYSADGFAARLTAAGFVVRKVRPSRLFSAADMARYGFNPEPVYFAAKPA